MLTDRHVAAFPGPPPKDSASESGEELPLVVCRRDDGVLVQRLAFPAESADSAVVLLPKGAIVATKTGVWALGPTAK